jgi:phosphatidylinositol-3-phosphatase
LTAGVDRAGVCENCGAQRRRGQRYCLDCGARIGSRSPQLLSLLHRVHERCAADRQASPGPLRAGTGTVPSASAARARRVARRPVPSLPSARVCSVLVLVFLGFGLLIGDVAASPVKLSAFAGKRVHLLLPSMPTVSTPSSYSSSAAPEGARSSAGESPSKALEASEPESPSLGEGAERSGPETEAGSGAKDGSNSSGSSSAGPGGQNGGQGAAPGASSSPPRGGSGSKLRSLRHVFVIMLSDQGYAAAFGPSSPAPYLSKTLERRGELLARYYAVAHRNLADGIALLSGQGPTLQTAADCPDYTLITPATVGAHEQVIGSGCVYPSSTKTLMGQLTAKHLPWRAYVEGMGEGPDGGDPTTGAAETGSDSAAAGACAHPALGTADPVAADSPPTPRPYATWANPFVYFSALTDAPACEAEDVGLNELSADLSNARRTPSFAYIVPDRCHDASPTPCAPGAPAGLADAEPFLRLVVPEIMGSAAYKENGLLVITFDQAPANGEFADSGSCCAQPAFPNLPAAASAPRLEGGGRVGALLLSPLVKHAVSHEPYNHFSLLRTIEDIFGLPHLGYAALPQISSFPPSIFTASN